MILNTLIFIFGAILFISAVMTAIAWYRYRHQLLSNLFLFWSSGIICFLAQGFLGQAGTTGLLAFGANAFAVHFLLKIYFLSIKHTDVKLIGYDLTLGVGLIFGLILSSAGYNHQGTLLFCITCCLVLLAGVFKVHRSQLDFFAKTYQALVVFAGIHFLDYPFFKSDPDLIVAGFAVSIGFYFAFSVFVPVFIIQKMSSDYVKKLEFEVENRTRQLAESYQHLELVFTELKDEKNKIKTLLSDTQIRMSALVHDVATPLQVISHSLNFLLKSKDNIHEVFDERMVRIQAAMKTLKQIIDEARSTHAELNGKADFSFKRVVIYEIVQEVLGMFDEKLKAKSLKVDCSDLLRFENLSVVANENWLKNQVISNLISNAVKFSNSGGVIAIRASVLDSGRVAILIDDNGVGISLKKRSAIFAFNEKTSTRGTAGELGTGLGLPIVKQYAELMGGHVKILDKSQPGTCFQIELPKAA